MYAQLLSDLTSKNSSLENQLRLSPYSRKSIDIYREEKYKLLTLVESLPVPEKTDASLLSVWKLGAEIASNIAHTRISDSSGDGFRVTTPYPAPAELRHNCRKIYDILIKRISAADRMYIMPAFEKTEPGKEKRLAAMRLYDLQHQKEQSEQQSANKSINRLFGSRG